MKLTHQMIEFLDKRRGSDLIRSAHEFAECFRLSREDAGLLIQQWMDLP